MKKSAFQPFRFAAVIASALLAVSASAQTSIKHADRSFIAKAARSGLEEVDISRIAVERATNPQVRAFAQMMVDDHGSVNEALTALAASKDVKLRADDRDDADKWTMKKPGNDFDEDYIEKMVSAHKDAVKLFTKEADKGEDAETKALARDTLPKLQHHLEQAIDLKKTLK